MYGFNLPEAEGAACQDKTLSQVQRLEKAFRVRVGESSRSLSRGELAWRALGANVEGLDWREKCLEKIQQETIQDIGRDPHFRLGNPCYEQARSNCFLGLELLEQTGTAFAREIRTVAPQVVLFRAKDFYSTSALYAHGVIWMNPQKHWTTAHYVDTLLHESGHLLLMLSQVEGRILENSFERMESPLRADSRPMVGVFHALFVLDRICQGLEAYAELPNAPDRDTALRLREDYERRFVQAWPEFEKRARPTERGRKILERLSLVPRICEAQ